jgi:hypothetical protein
MKTFKTIINIILIIAIMIRIEENAISQNPTYFNLFIYVITLALLNVTFLKNIYKQLV